MLSTALSAAAAIGSAVGSALCCAGPILYVTVGVGAGLAGTFEPLRPWLLGASVLFLGLGFLGVHSRSVDACVEAGICDTVEEAERRRRRQALVLWLAAGLVALFATLPSWVAWLT
ncbi:MAG: hypothetical protein GWM92_07885 [Gemmatimonadetes bacterium]|nr:hypothetical protein [Gemmatimonadota bacterium]NIR77941.1 hypothetical protein [Gemmatimonadota bacterium]NIT87161.1 hypothetical protein [Gemmatimonadota bacterium]NIU30328.1 hypothetical protein [Gemmatimonadota bacterium]NIU35219.1 hypothetical protein [Gemmatimonadota bacterium]